MKPDDGLAKRLAEVIATPTRSLDDNPYWHASLIAVASAIRPQVNSGDGGKR